jgi:MFS family permease
VKILLSHLSTQQECVRKEDRRAVGSKKAFWLGVVNGVVHVGAQAFAQPETVIPSFIGAITSSDRVAGFLLSLQNVATVTIPLVSANLAESTRRKKPLYMFWAIMRVIAAFGLALVVLSGRNGYSTVQIAGIMLCLICFLASQSGLSVPFMDIVAKVIEPGRRGMFFGLRFFGGALSSVGASAFAKYVFEHPETFPFPMNYGYLFLALAFGMAVTAVVFGFIEEPDGVRNKQRMRLPLYVMKGVNAVKHDRSLRLLLITRALMSIVEQSIAFYMVTLQRGLVGIGAYLGALVLSQTLGKALSGIVWGYIADSAGNATMTRMASMVGVGIPILIIGGYLLASNLHGSLGPMMLVIAFFFAGWVSIGVMTGCNNISLEIAPAADRPTYLWLMTVAMAPGILFPMIAGILRSYFSLPLICCIPLAAAVAAVFTTKKLEGFKEHEIKLSSAL